MSACVYLVDTSVLCNLLNIPHRCQDRQQAVRDWNCRQGAGCQFYLPLATILETGNHIAHVDDGGTRRNLAERFVRLVKDAVSGESPFRPLGFWNRKDLFRWIDSFTDYSSQGLGFGDLSIIKEFERLCSVSSGVPMAQPIAIWSYDKHLQGYSRAAE